MESAHLGQADEGADESGVEVSKESPPTPRENAEEAADPELEGREPGEVAQRRTGAADGAPPQRPLSDAEGNRGDGPRGPARRGSRSSGGRKQE